MARSWSIAACRLVIVCILLDLCCIASPASRSQRGSTPERCHPEDVLLNIRRVDLPWPAAAGRAGHVDKIVLGVAQEGRYEASLSLVKHGVLMHEEWLQFHGDVDQDDQRAEYCRGTCQRISFPFPPLTAGHYTEHFAVYDACGLSASLSASDEEDLRLRLLARLNRVVDVEEAVWNLVSERADQGLVTRSVGSDGINKDIPPRPGRPAANTPGDEERGDRSIESERVFEFEVADVVADVTSGESDNEEYETDDVNYMDIYMDYMAVLTGDEGRGIWPVGHTQLMQEAFAENYSSGFDSCDRTYQLWRGTTRSTQMMRVCMDRLLALAPRWRCIGSGCSACSSRCQEVLAWELDGAQGRRDPDFLKQDGGHSEAAVEASNSLETFMVRTQDSGLGFYPEGLSLIAVVSAPGPRFRARRQHSEALLSDLQIAGVLSTAVTLDMVQEGGWLESCVLQPQSGAGVSLTFFASALNHLHTFVHALQLGFENLVVFEDDMLLKSPVGRKPSLLTHIVLDTLHDAEIDNYDLLSFGDCAQIHPDPATDARIRAYENRVVSSTGDTQLLDGWDPSLYRELWRVSKGSRCAGSYAVSRTGMFKALLHLPMWCTMDFMLNGAKHAVVKDALRTSVLFLEPALFEEGSKRNMFKTTMSGCHYCESP